MNRKIKFLPGSYFHIYNRGVEKRKIFTGENDYHRFLILLYLCNNTEPVNLRDIFDKGLTFEEMFELERKETLVDIGAYCLMPNHIHLLITPTKTKENGIPLLMQKIFTGYTMYFNKRNERSGRLFESTFKANLVDKDEYFKYLFAYIHLNPIKLIEPTWKDEGIKNLKKVEEFLNDYQWSSYSSYINDINEEENDPLLNKKSFPEYFCKINEFRNFIEEWLRYKNSNFP